MKRPQFFLSSVCTFLGLALFVLASCNKTEDTKAEITVLTATETPVEGAEVNLYAEGTLNDTVANDYRFPEDGFTEYTDASGVATFDFTEYYKAGQSGFAILNVAITKSYPDTTGEAEGVIKIVEEEVSTKTFTLE